MIEAVRKIIDRHPYAVNVAFLAVSQWGDLFLTKGMVAKQGDWVEASPRKEYYLSNMELISVLKLVAIPAIIITTAYLADKKFPQHKNKLTTALRIMNVGMMIILIINSTLNFYNFH